MCGVGRHDRVLGGGLRERDWDWMTWSQCCGEAGCGCVGMWCEGGGQGLGEEQITPLSVSVLLNVCIHPLTQIKTILHTNFKLQNI